MIHFLKGTEHKLGHTSTLFRQTAKWVTPAWGPETKMA